MDELREAIANLIKDDDDFYYFVMWSFGTCLRQISKEAEEGRDDEPVKAYKKFYAKLSKRVWKNIVGEIQ